MTPRPCGSCKMPISTDAKACPHCGTRPPSTSRRDLLCGLVAIVIMGAIAVKACGSNDADAANVKDEATCRKELACWGEKGVIAAGTYCKDPIERLARHSVRWTDGVMDMKFSRYRWADEPNGAIAFVGDRAEFQNGFGAFSPVIYTCVLAADHRTVLDVHVIPGRLEH